MSSSPPRRQHYLDLGEQAHFDLLHGSHRANVAVATKGAVWVEKTYPHSEAMAVAFAMQGWADSYLSQNGFAGKRGIESVSAITSCFADLDTYNIPGLDGLSSDDLLDRMQAAHPWLPLPTVTIESGRGFYASWVLRSPLTHSQLARWQSVQNALITALSLVGADPNAKDAARVFRVVGSVNSKTGVAVTARQTGECIAFEQLERLILTHALPAKPRLLLVVDNAGFERIEQRVSTATAAQRRQYVLGYQLAFDRMADYATIARLRGSPRMRDYRHRLLYCYAISGAWYWSGVEQAEGELVTFARTHFADSARYKARTVQTVLDRMAQGKAGVRGIFNGAAVDRRYRMQNRTIIATLDLSPVEQRGLKTIIGKPEREDRRAARRRAAGMVDRQAQADDRQRRALELRAAGMSQTAIAGELGVTRQAVSKMLRA